MGKRADFSWIPHCSEKAFRRRIDALPPELRPAALAVRARCDPALFATLGLPEAFRLPFARFHRTLFAWHARMGTEPLQRRAGLRFALAAPRGFAKSSVASFLLVLHDLFYRRERYIVLVSATQRQAQQRLRAIRAELHPKRPLPRWFGWPRERPVASGRVLEAGGLRVEAFGAGTEMRGIVHDAWRPTKIVLDDAESSASAASPTRRARLLDWFAEVVEPLGGPYTHLLVVGTVLHPEGLLARLLERPDFESLRCAAVERFPPPNAHWDRWRAELLDRAHPNGRAAARAYFEKHRAEMERDARVLWPEHLDCERLLAQLHLQGRRAFHQEMQNAPLAAEDALFDVEAVWKARDEGNAIRILPPAHAQPRWVAMKGLRRFGAIDSALGKSRSARRGDFAAIACVDATPDGLLIARTMWVRRAPPSAQAVALMDLHANVPFERVAVEGTGFQELLLLPIREEAERRRMQGRAADVPLTTSHPTKAKETRIASLEPLLASGRLVLGEGLPEEFWRELTEYPRTAHDDALDALAAAVELAQRSITAGREGSRAVSVSRKRPGWRW